MGNFTRKCVQFQPSIEMLPPTKVVWASGHFASPKQATARRDGASIRIDFLSRSPVRLTGLRCAPYLPTRGIHRRTRIASRAICWERNMRTGVSLESSAARQGDRDAGNSAAPLKWGTPLPPSCYSKSTARWFVITTWLKLCASPWSDLNGVGCAEGFWTSIVRLPGNAPPDSRWSGLSLDCPSRLTRPGSHVTHRALY